MAEVPASAPSERASTNVEGASSVRDARGPKVTITWTLRDYYRTTFDLSVPEERQHLAYLLDVESEDDIADLIAAAEHLDDAPDYDVADKFADNSMDSTWFDRDPGDCVRITDVRVDASSGSPEERTGGATS